MRLFPKQLRQSFNESKTKSETYRLLVEQIYPELRTRLSLDGDRVTQHYTGRVTVHLVVADDLETGVIVPSLFYVFLMVFSRLFKDRIVNEQLFR